MKLIHSAIAVILLLGAVCVQAEDKKVEPKKEGKEEKAKPYLLKKCVVSDEAFGGDMGEPFIFAYKGQEMKLCCKNCKKDFDKDPEKFIKKMKAEEKKAAKK
jgi:YHS domain-containing protein